MLIDKGMNVAILISNGTDTLNVVSQALGGETTNWCRVVEQTENVCDLFSQADCFVSTSVAETFSYAICEASIYGLPVIQSDIEATLWNAGNPSTLLFKSLDVADLADKMEQMIYADKEDMAKRCLRTREHNIEAYSIEKWVNNIIEFYNQL